MSAAAALEGSRTETTMSSYAVLIAAAFIIATVAVAALSPFDHLPQRVPQTTAAAAPPEEDSGNSSQGSSSSPESLPDNDGSNMHWPPNEAPPE
jgi:hypothetical protein